MIQQLLYFCPVVFVATLTQKITSDFHVTTGDPFVLLSVSMLAVVSFLILKLIMFACTTKSYIARRVIKFTT